MLLIQLIHNYIKRTLLPYLSHISFFLSFKPNFNKLNRLFSFKFHDLSSLWDVSLCFCVWYSSGEFHRITNQSLQYSFVAALDKNTPQRLKLYKERKTGAFGEKMADLLMGYDEQVRGLLICLLKGGGNYNNNY